MDISNSAKELLEVWGKCLDEDERKKIFFCSNCKKLLGLIEGKEKMKCRKCKTVNDGSTLKEYSGIHHA